MSAERELLKRLVKLKDRKDAMATEAIVSRGPTTEALAQYRRGKDAAWAEARALLAQPERNPQWQPIETAPKDAGALRS